jgi:hypothetical protein
MAEFEPVGKEPEQHAASADILGVLKQLEDKVGGFTVKSAVE